jgi:hypothetical protein
MCLSFVKKVYLPLTHSSVFQGKHKAAKEAYEQLVECQDIPSTLKANALRQLGKLVCQFY